MKRTTFTFPDVKAALDEMRVTFKVSGEVPVGAFGFASLRGPESSGIFFVEDPALDPDLIESGVVFTRMSLNRAGVVSIIVAHPQAVFYRLMQHLLSGRGPGEVHTTAIVDPEAVIHSSAVVGPFCVIEKATIGPRVRLGPHVVVFEGCDLEEDSVVDAHSAIGATGVAWVWDPDTGKRVCQPQTGGVRIRSGCFVGNNVGISRGSVNEVTEIGVGTVIAQGTKIGHGCRVGAHAHLANNVSLGGNVDLGARVFLGSGSVVRPRISIADDTVIAAGAVVVQDILRAGSLWMGVPAAEATERGSLSGVPKPFEGERR